ncbi:MAG: hypothetical protein RL065_1857 [Bacteroidota bacterium]|jgi:copper chaperone
METEIKIDNLKCNGCATSIKNGLVVFAEIKSVDINWGNSSLKIEHSDLLSIEKVKHKLLQMGYPETGSVEGIERMTANAKSYVSCAIGKISNH